jgi:hypothetical protein
VSCAASAVRHKYLEQSIPHIIWYPASSLEEWRRLLTRPDVGAVWDKEQSAQCHLLRDIIGSPFRPPPRIDVDWLSWNDGTIPKLAQIIYTGRRFNDLPILADALEEAGCGEADILNHCRQPSEHVRGCWVVDLVLGKA